MGCGSRAPPPSKNYHVLCAGGAPFQLQALAASPVKRYHGSQAGQGPVCWRGAPGRGRCSSWAGSSWFFCLVQEEKSPPQHAALFSVLQLCPPRQAPPFCSPLCRNSALHVWASYFCSPATDADNIPGNPVCLLICQSH